MVEETLASATHSLLTAFNTKTDVVEYSSGINTTRVSGITVDTFSKILERCITLIDSRVGSHRHNASPFPAAEQNRPR